MNENNFVFLVWCNLNMWLHYFLPWIAQLVATFILSLIIPYSSGRYRLNPRTLNSVFPTKSKQNYCYNTVFNHALDGLRFHNAIGMNELGDVSNSDRRRSRSEKRPVDSFIQNKVTDFLPPLLRCPLGFNIISGRSKHSHSRGRSYYDDFLLFVLLTQVFYS